MDLSNSPTKNRLFKDKMKSTSISNKQLIVEPSQISSAVLQRLLNEVRHDTENNISAYNRTHNRHNRGR